MGDGDLFRESCWCNELGGGTCVKAGYALPHMEWDSQPFQGGVESGMLDHIKGIAEVNEEHVDVFLVKVCILDGVDNVAYLPVCIFAGTKAFLCGGENVVRFCEGGEGTSEETCPDFSKDVGHGYGSVVAKVKGGAFLVEKVSVALGPRSWCVLVCPEVAEKGVE